MTFMNPLSNLQQPNPNKPNLVRRLFASPQGTQVQYVDPITGQVIQNPQGYNILEPQISDLKSLDLLPTVSATETPETPKPDETIKPSYDIPGSDHSTNGINGYSGTSNRDQGNNFGYIDKPGWMGMTSMLPGPLGLAGKGINAAVNANNVQAINSARDAADLLGLSGMQELGGIAKDRQGFVGRADIKNKAGQTNQYSIGLEAVDPWGRTTLTPDEARARASANPQNISLSEKQTGNKEKSSGLGSKISESIRSFLDDIFSDDTETKPSKTSYPDAPSTPKGFTGEGNKDSTSTYDGTSYSGQNKGDDSPSEGVGRFGGGGLGLSDKAKGDVDKGKGGLY